MLYPVNMGTEENTQQIRKWSMCEPGVMRGTLSEYFNLPLCPDPWKNAHANYVNRTKWYENHLVVFYFFKMELLNKINCIHVLAHQIMENIIINGHISRYVPNIQDCCLRISHGHACLNVYSIIYGVYVKHGNTLLCIYASLTPPGAVRNSLVCW